MELLDKPMPAKGGRTSQVALGFGLIAAALIGILFEAVRRRAKAKSKLTFASGTLAMAPGREPCLNETLGPDSSLNVEPPLSGVAAAPLCAAGVNTPTPAASGAGGEGCLNGPLALHSGPTVEEPLLVAAVPICAAAASTPVPTVSPDGREGCLDGTLGLHSDPNAEEPLSVGTAVPLCAAGINSPAPTVSRNAVPLPIIDPTKNIPLLNMFAGRPFRHLCLAATCLVLFVVPLIVLTGLDGTLLSDHYSAQVNRVGNNMGLPFCSSVCKFVSRKHVTHSLCDDLGGLLILAAILPAFIVISSKFYSGFGRMVLALHQNKTHVALRSRSDYESVVLEYNRAFSSPLNNIPAWLIGFAIASLLALARTKLSWWGAFGNVLSAITYLVAGTTASYYLGGIGTMRGAIAFRFCIRYFKGPANVFTLSPWHPDGYNGLRYVGDVVSAIYVGALLSGFCLFVCYRSSMFGERNWLLAFLIVFVVAAYSVFLSVPSVMILRRCLEFRNAKLESLNNAITTLSDSFEAAELNPISIGNGRAELAIRLQAMMRIHEAYRRMSVIPLSLRQILLGWVFYIAQVAQVASVVLFVSKK